MLPKNDDLRIDRFLKRVQLRISEWSVLIRGTYFSPKIALPSQDNWLARLSLYSGCGTIRRMVYVAFWGVVMQDCSAVIKDTYQPGEMICSSGARKPCSSLGIDSLRRSDSICFYLDWSKHYGDHGLGDCVRAKIVSTNDSTILLTGHGIASAAGPYMRLVSPWVWELKRSEILALFRVSSPSDSKSLTPQ